MSHSDKQTAKPAVNKIKVAEWPIASGDYVVGDSSGCVAVCTLATEGIVRPLGLTPGVAICGGCKTENVGIEKVILNVISNPNIRFMLVCGTEVAGHVTGGCLKALWQLGVDSNTKKIRNAPGAIPYVEAVPGEGVERFRKQIQLVDMINVEDVEALASKIGELTTQDPGAYPEPPMVVRLAERREEKPAVIRLPLTVSLPPAIDSIKNVIKDIEYRTQLISREKRLTMGVHTTRLLGIVTGFLFALAVLLLLLLTVGTG